MGVLSFFAKRQEILSSNGFLSVERSFLYTHPNTRDPSQVQSKRPFAYEKGILWPFRWQQNSLAPVEICRLAPIQPEVITCVLHFTDDQMYHFQDKGDIKMILSNFLHQVFNFHDTICSILFSFIIFLLFLS